MVDISLRVIRNIGDPTIALRPHFAASNQKPTCVSDLRWRIDGSADCGTRYFAVCTTLLPNLPPLRIDVLIPEQSNHPDELREALLSGLSVVLKDSRLARLPIAHYICHVLDNWSRGIPNFTESFLKLPFGSSIVIPKITSSKYTSVCIMPAHELERSLISVPSLQAVWREEVSIENWPAVIDLSELKFCRQLHDSISLVVYRQESLIFKSAVTDPKFLYHELKILLTLPPHCHVLGRPLYIVTKRCAFGRKKAICGFIIPCFSAGSLRDALPSLVLQNKLSLDTQLMWAHQITTALCHIFESGSFYSDLRPDNILLTEDGSVVLIDFEQRGNWFAWSAPEIRYHEYLQIITSSSKITDQAKAYYRRYLDLCFPNSAALTSPDVSTRSSAKSTKDPNRYTNPKNGYYTPWAYLSPPEREAAAVYALGKLFWCLFEGQGAIEHSLQYAPRHGVEIDFPTWRRTPQAVRSLISACFRKEDEERLIDMGEKQGLGEAKQRRRVWRKGGKLIVKDGCTELENEEDVWAVAREEWVSELEKMERWLDKRVLAQQKPYGVVNGEPLFPTQGRRLKLREILDRIQDIRSKTS